MSRSWKLPRFDLLEVTLIVVVAVMCIIMFIATLIAPHYQRMVERDWLLAKYGPAHYSFGVEELVIRDFFQDRKGGVFVDVGASHYKKDSNTYYLESQLGWSGLAVDAVEEYEADYERYRPHTRFVARFVSDRSNGELTLFVPSDKRQSSDWIRPEYGAAQRRSVATVTLNDLLVQEHISAFDLLALDIELSEPKALAGFDIERYRPALVCVEAWQPVRQQVLDYFARHGYTVVGKYLRTDSMNLYYAPLPSSR